MSKMATKLTVFILVLGVATQSCSAQFWRQQNGYTYQLRYPQQQPYPNYNQQRAQYQQQQQQNGYQLPPGVSVSEAEWVCKNPKTGDMMIITSEDVPTSTGNNGQQPSYPQQRPPTNNQPTYPQKQPTYPQTQSNYPQTQPNYPHTQPPMENQPTNPQTPKPEQPQQPNQGPPNTNGDGLIDIRFGN